MVANLENTVRKWRAVRNALGRAQGAPAFRGFRGASFVINKNAPAYENVLRNYERAINLHGNDITTHQLALDYFGLYPHTRQYITAAYNKLPSLHNQLNKVANKILTVRKLQKIRRSTAQARNKREKDAKMLETFRVVKNLPQNMASRQIVRNIYANLHKSKTPYGPQTEINAIRTAIRSGKYRTY
jgi:hypothetical protein